MAETQILQNNETSAAIDGDKLLKDSQDREFDRLLLSLESDRYTLFDLQDIVIQIGNNKPKDCEQTFQDINFDPMFGFTTGNGSKQASSGCAQ